MELSCDVVNVAVGGGEAMKLRGSGGTTFLCMDTSSSCAVVGAKTGSLYLYDLPNLAFNRIVSPFNKHLPITRVRFSPDGSLLAASDSEGLVYIVNFEKNEKIAMEVHEHVVGLKEAADMQSAPAVRDVATSPFSPPSTPCVTCIEWFRSSRMGLMLATADSTGVVVISAVSNANRSEVVERFKAESAVMQIDVHPDNQRLVVSTLTKSSLILLAGTPCANNSTVGVATGPRGSRVSQIGEKKRGVGVMGACFNKEEIWVVRPGARLWSASVDTSKVMATLKVGVDAPPTSLPLGPSSASAWSHGSDEKPTLCLLFRLSPTIVASVSDSTLHIVDTNDARIVRSYRSAHPIIDACVLPSSPLASLFILHKAADQPCISKHFSASFPLALGVGGSESEFPSPEDSTKPPTRGKSGSRKHFKKKSQLRSISEPPVKKGIVGAMSAKLEFANPLPLPDLEADDVVVSHGTTNENSYNNSSKGTERDAAGGTDIGSDAGDDARGGTNAGGDAVADAGGGTDIGGDAGDDARGGTNAGGDAVADAGGGTDIGGDAGGGTDIGGDAGGGTDIGGDAGGGTDIDSDAGGGTDIGGDVGGDARGGIDIGDGAGGDARGGIDIGGGAGGGTDGLADTVTPTSDGAIDEGGGYDDGDVDGDGDDVHVPLMVDLGDAIEECEVAFSTKSYLDAAFLEEGSVVSECFHYVLICLHRSMIQSAVNDIRVLRDMPNITDAATPPPLVVDRLLTLLRDPLTGLSDWEMVFMTLCLQTSRSRAPSVTVSCPCTNVVEALISGVGAHKAFYILDRCRDRLCSRVDWVFHRLILQSEREVLQRRSCSTLLENIDSYMWGRRQGQVNPNMRSVHKLESGRYLRHLPSLFKPRHNRRTSVADEKETLRQDSSGGVGIEDVNGDEAYVPVFEHKRPLPTFLEEGSNSHCGVYFKLLGTECPVCSMMLGEVISAPEDVVVLECGHCFHSACLPGGFCLVCINSNNDLLADGCQM